MRESGAMRRALPVVRAVTVVAVGLSLVSCGSSKPTDAGTVVGFEMGFRPSQVTTEAGPVELRFRNDGKTFHELAVERDGAVLERVSVAPGESAVLEIDLDPGRYEMTCREPGHYEGGMRGTLEAR